MNNKKMLPFVEDLKSVVFDFEHDKYTVNDHDISHCTDLSVTFHNGYWNLSFEMGSDFITLKKKRIN